jgi:hypothetical protein
MIRFNGAVFYLLIYLTLYSCQGKKDKAIESILNPQILDSGKSSININIDSLTKTKGASQNIEGIGESKNNANSVSGKSNKFETQIFRNNESNSFGYDIIVEGRVYVHQPNVPARAGNNGFVSEVQAEKVAHLVLNKIKMNILPPTVSIEELDSLGIK